MITDPPPASVISGTGKCWTMLRNGLYTHPGVPPQTLRALHHFDPPLTHRPTVVITTADIQRWEDNQ